MTVYTLFGQPALGLTATNDTSTYTMGMQFTLSQSATLTGIWFYSGATATARPVGCAIYQMTGPGAGTIVSGSQDLAPVWSGAAASGWIKDPYASGPVLAASTVYKVVMLKDATALVYSLTANYWSSGAGGSGLTSGIITAPNNAGGDGGQDTFNVGGSLAYPATAFNASNYWVDVEVTTSSAAAATPQPVVVPSLAAIQAACW